MRTPFFLHKYSLVCRVSSEPSERQGHERDATKRGVTLRRESINELKKDVLKPRTSTESGLEQCFGPNFQANRLQMSKDT